MGPIIAGGAVLPLPLANIPVIPTSVASRSQGLVVSTTPSGAPITSMAISTPVSCYPIRASPLTLTESVKPKLLPFRVASTIVHLSAKLVQRIQALEFVDMLELLTNNIALTEHLVVLPPGLPPQRTMAGRQIGGEKAILSWVSSFATYVAVVAQAHPARTADMLAYTRLIVR